MTSTIAQPDYTGLDNSIKAGSGATGAPDYVANNGIIGANFYQTGNRVDFTTNGRNFTWSPLNMKYVDETGMEDIIYSVQDVPIEVKANYARFNRPMTDVDDWFIFENNMLKHQILVQGFQRDPAPYLSGEIDFVFGGQINFDSDLTISVDGFSNVTGPFETGGSIHFLDSDGREVYSLPQIVAYDSGIPNRAQTTGKYRVTQNSSGVLAFDIVVDNGWFADTARIYPIVIDPTVVVSSAYDTSGNGGRKIVHLSNGWIVTAIFNSGSNYFYFYVSKDNGQTWSLLTETSDFVPTTGNFAIASNGTNVYAVFNATGGGGNTNVFFYKFDATTVGAAIPYVSKPDTGQSSFGSGVTIAVDGTGAIHAAWVSKNNTYLNSFNIRYSKSTDGGATWSTPTQVTANSLSGYDVTNPCIVLKSNNYPLIVAQQYVSGSTTYYIYAFAWNGTSWGSAVTVYSLQSYAQSNPCAAVDSNDAIYVVWHGPNSSNSANFVKYSKSTDGGSTWSTPIIVQSSTNYAQQNATISIDSNNNLYFFYQGIDTAKSTTYFQIKKTTYINSTWATTTLTSNTTANAQNPQSHWSKFNMNSSDAIRYLYQDSQAGAVEYDSIYLNSPPNAPTNLSPTGGTAVTTLTPTLSGTFSDPDSGNTMSALQVQVYRSSDNTLMWDSGKVAKTTTTGNQNWSITVPSSANLAWQTQYYWKATTWDNSSAQGAWSGNQVFLTEQAPTVTITAPTAAQVVTTSSIVAQLSYSQVNNVAEASYQFQLLDANGNVLQDSGVINGSNNQYTFNNLTNNTSYQIVGYATTKDGAKGTSAKVSFSTSFTPPTNPTVTGSSSSATASVTINWVNPSSSVAVAYNRLYKQTNGAWVLYQDQLTGTSYTDYLVGSGVATTYGVSAVGTNGVESPIVSITQTVNFAGDWLYNPNNGKQFQFLYSRQAYDMTTQEERKEYQTFGNKPMVRRGPLNARTGTMGALMVQVGTSQTPIQQLQVFEADRLTYPTYYLKTAAGEVLKIDTHNYTRKMPVEYLNTQAIGCQFDWTEVA